MNRMSFRTPSTSVGLVMKRPWNGIGTFGKFLRNLSAPQIPAARGGPVVAAVRAAGRIAGRFSH